MQVQGVRMIKRAGTVEVRSDEKDRELRAQARSQRSNSFSKLADQLAEHNVFFRNWVFPVSVGLKADPNYKMNTNDLYYPYSPKGPLFIDMPITAADIAICEKKKLLLKDSGIRYLFIKPGQSYEDVRVDMMEAFV
jgi:hypothetical protein